MLMGLDLTYNMKNRWLIAMLSLFLTTAGTNTARAYDASGGFEPKVTLQDGQWQRWRDCSIRMNEQHITCRLTRMTVSRETGSINIHFELDDSFENGLTFVATPEAAERISGTRIYTDFIGVRSGTVKLIPSPGMCVLSPSSFPCITEDSLVRGSAKKLSLQRKEGRLEQSCKS